MRWSPLLLLLALVPSDTQAWSPNGVRLTGAPDDQDRPLIASDGAGGAFVAWSDWRNFSSQNTGTDLFLQRVTAAGQIASGWPANGLEVASGPKTQGAWAILSDGSGGVLVVYGDFRSGAEDLYLQRITATATVSPGWPVGGVPIAVAPGDQTSPELAGDGTGGAFVSWQDGLDAATTRARYTHILGTGVLAPGWPAEGRLFEPTALFVLRPLMLETGDGGFLACWPVSDDTLKTVTLRAHRFMSEGTADPSWPAGGLTACSTLPFHRVPRARLAPDGSGGFYVIFADGRNSGSPAEDLYAQHVLGAGAIATGWPADGLQVTAIPGVTEQSPSLCEDGQGGVFFAWEDYRSGYARVFAQHFAADGQRHPGWPALGLSFTDRPGFQISPQLAWDSQAGAYVTWMILESTGYRSYVQHLTSGGSAWPGWPGNGLPVIPLATDQYVPAITADGVGGAIVAWEDIRSLERDIYAQRFIANGVVATQVSVASAESTPEEVRIRWHVSGETSASVERREGAGGWQAIAQVEIDGGGFMSFIDRHVTPGLDYGYRLAFSSGTLGGETSVSVPAAFALALEGARPNPAVGALWVAFTLPSNEQAQLELYDLAGRKLFAREIGARGAGRHVIRLDDGALAPGLYWAALTQGAHTLRTHVVMMK